MQYRNLKQFDNEMRTSSAPTSKLVTRTSSVPGLKFCKKLVGRKKNRIIVLFFVAALISVILLLVLVFISQSENDDPEPPEIIPNFIYRDKWGGREPLNITPVELLLPMVIMKHTRCCFCLLPENCEEGTLKLQNFYLAKGYPDISFNFLIGGDGNIYVGRGWGVANQQNNLSLDIAVFGNYNYDTFFPYMINATKYLINQGVQLKYLAKDYVVVCHNQTDIYARDTPNIYKEVSTWEHFSNETYYDNY